MHKGLVNEFDINNSWYSLVIKSIFGQIKKDIEIIIHFLENNYYKQYVSHVTQTVNAW